MGAFRNLKGQHFGWLLVESFSKRENKKTYWNCICKCGKRVTVRADQLTSGSTKSCGCYNVYSHSLEAGNFKDLKGKTFGYWKVLYKVDERKASRVAWYCRCKCGTERVVSSGLLLSGESLSCGCYNKEMSSKKNSKHKMSKTRLYNIWLGMNDRCRNPNNCKYHLYGGKGIKVCEEWSGENGFENFMKWANEHGYKENLTIDRYPNKNGNYEPSNCRWATSIEQANNISTNVLVTYKNEIHTISEWSKLKGINKNTLRYRVYKGWDEDALFIKPQRNKK